MAGGVEQNSRTPYKRKGLGLSATFIFKDSFAESEFSGKNPQVSAFIFL